MSTINNHYSLYQNSSEAYKLYDDYIPVRRRTGAKHEVKKEAVRKVEVKNNPTFNIKVFLFIGIIFIFSIITLCYYASATTIRINNNELISQVNLLKEKNSVLEAEIAKSVDLKEVEKIATTKLGMQKPLAYQIVYINVPKQSYTIQYETSQDSMQAETFSLSKILNYFNKD